MMFIFLAIFVPLIVAILVYIPLKGSGFLPLKNNVYRPPLKPSDFNKNNPKKP